MKPYFLVFLFFGMLVISCEPEEEDSGKPYFQFDNSDYELIINYNYEVGQVITYENQFGEQLHFKVISKEYGKTEKLLSTFWGSHYSLLYYYDRKTIRLKILENQNNNNSESINYDELVNYIFSKSSNYRSDPGGEFKNAINFPLWNISSYSFIDQIQNDINISLGKFNDNTKIEMNINGHQFNRVVAIVSEEDTTLIGDGALPNNVYKVYYDYDFGIIRFDDLDGKQWEVIYPD